MTKPKKSTTKARKFVIAGKEELEKDAPVVSNEFIIPDAKEGELAQGQTVTVSADKKFSDDLGIGEPRIVRTFEFAVNQETFGAYFEAFGRNPTAQEIFDSHKQGIAAMLWGDGLVPAEEIEPQVIFSKNKVTYLIVVGAKPMMGRTLIERTQTLTEIFNEPTSKPPH